MDRREQILRAAGEVAAEQGMAAMSVRAVAARAGIGASTLRHYFPTQQALYEAVVGDALDAQVDDLRITDASLSPVERLAECLAQFLPADAEQVRLLDAWLAAHARAIGPDGTTDGGRALDALTRRGRVRLLEWLDALGAEDVLRHPDHERHADLLLALLDGLSMQLLTSAISVDTARALLRDVVAGVVVRT